jgi:hypothetical protein
VDALASPDWKDAMVAIMGAAVALAGLLLVFSGFLFSQAASFPAETSDTTIGKYKGAAEIGLLPFAASLLLAVLALGYWVFPTHCFAVIVAVLFALLCLATILYGFWASRRL